MQILVNGAPHAIAGNATVAELIEHMGLTGKRFAVELNEQILPRSRHPEWQLEDGDEVEIIQAIGGG